MLCDIPYMWNLKDNANKCVYEAETDLHRKQIYGHQWGEGGRDKSRI